MPKEHVDPFRMDDLPLPARATAWLPGTVEKQIVMRERLGAGKHLHHPGDAKNDGDGRCMIPILEPKNHKILGYRVLTEAEYRKEVHYESWWGQEACTHPEKEILE